MIDPSLLFGFEGLSIGIWGVAFFALAFIACLIPKDKDSKTLKSIIRLLSVKYKDGGK